MATIWQVDGATGDPLSLILWKLIFPGCILVDCRFCAHDLRIAGLNMHSRQGDRGVMTILDRLHKISDSHEGNLSEI